MTENLGGTESFIINFWREFDNKNIKIDFVKTGDHLYFEDEILKKKVEFSPCQLEEKIQLNTL